MKARLFVLGGRDVGRSFEVGESCVLGRGEECDVRLLDRSVSRAHARISRRDGAWILEDLGSRNGVRLRGERVERAELADLDEFVLGELALRFRLEARAASSGTPSAALAPEPVRVDVEADVESPALPEEIVLEHEPSSAVPRPTAVHVALAPRAATRARGNLFSWDLAELPGWQRGLAVLLALGLALALGWLAFRTVLGLRGTL
jgi:predicted component of type VI protein secretion system